MEIKTVFTNEFNAGQRLQIIEALDWFYMVIHSDEFRWKSRKYPEREIFIKNIQGFTLHLKRLYPEKGNRAMLYFKESRTVSFNFSFAFGFSKEMLAGYLGHEIGHQWFDHDEFEIDGFLGFLQYKVKHMKGRSNWYYKFLLWINQLFK